MDCFLINLYSDFHCMAGECPKTCCSGWKIQVSEKDYARFQEIENQELREDILKHIQKKNQAYYFENLENGDCAMLDSDGLCRIERFTSERMLCNTCRKYPRIYRIFDNMAFFSMAASCPVTAHAIVMNQVQILQRTLENELTPVSVFEIPFCKRVILFYHSLYETEKAVFEYESMRNGFKECVSEVFAPCLASFFESLADIILDVLLTYQVPLEKEVLRLLSYYEMERTEKEIFLDVQFFYMNQKEMFSRIKKAYVPYRMFGRWIEYPEESEWENYVQVCGELAVFYFFIFLKFGTHQVEEKEWEEMLTFSYRLLVHGADSAKGFHEEFCALFSKEAFWKFYFSDIILLV